MLALSTIGSSLRRSPLLLVDLSNNNPDPIEWRRVKAAGVFGVWLKVSEGQSFTDRTFAARAKAARAAGLRVGGYHFARPTSGGAPAEAAYFASRLGKVERLDLRPVLDLEANDQHLAPLELYAWARSFLRHVHRLTGSRALTYSGPWFLSAQAWPHVLGTGAGLWLADYGPNDGHDHGATAPHPWRRFVAHQYTSRGSVPGIPGAVDLSHAPTRLRLLAHPLRGLR